MTHIPVLAKEVITWLDPKPGENFIDGTVGLGGHARLILEKTRPDGRLLAFDRDAENLEFAKKNLQGFGQRAVFIHDSFSALKQNAYAHGFDQVDGLLLDLGFSSAHIENPKRGFSFQLSGPLDMRYDLRQGLTAEVIVNSWRAADLADIFRHYGDERHGQKIAERIVEERRRQRIETTTRLADIILSVAPYRGRLHPATQVFQALRIAVNDELSELERTLPQTLEVLRPQGKLAVIAFHSLEDRLVKQFMKKRHKSSLQILTKKPLSPAREEIEMNPRSRSAKLRVAEKL